MRKLLLPLLGLFVLVNATAVSAEQGATPSEDAKKVAKKAKEATHTFDPQAYTCKQFIEELNKEKPSERLGIAIIWGHGYFSAEYGTDEMGPLTEESVAEVVQDFVEYCEEDEAATFSRAAHRIIQEE